MGDLMTMKLEAVRLDRRLAAAGSNRLFVRSLVRQDLVSYSVVEAPGAPPAARSVEKRSSERRRLRLRSGKLLDSHNRFLCECLVRDRSGYGLRLVLARNIGLPPRYHLYDDETGSVHAIATVWRRSVTLGVRFCLTALPPKLRESDRSALRGRYYAMVD
jgi:hypothetical protein